MNALQLFTTLLLVQLFWSLSVSLVVPYMPNAASNQVVMFNNSNNMIELSTLQTSISSGITDQQNIPLLEVGALVFYSSATILNIMINFFTAIPQMVTLLMTVFFLFIPIPVGLQITLQAWVFGIVTVLYFIVLFTFLMGTRTNLGSMLA